ncbi:MAG: hypothetical protein ABWZ25_17460 [Chitinophagaceae bacterium]
MNKKEKLLIGFGALALTGLLIFSVRRAKACKMLKDVSDEGYETAPDVLYPGKRKSGRTHYGPVLPS